MKPRKPTDLKAETLNNLMNVRRKLTRNMERYPDTTEGGIAFYTQIITKIDNEIKKISRMSPEELADYLKETNQP